jgi:septum formation protein
VRLYLASTSPARLATLRAAGIEPVLIASGVDEEAAVAAAGPLTAPEMVLLLARLKAEAVVGRVVDGEPIDGFILGGDSAFELDGVAYGKPHLPEVARERWMAQRGREGLLHSGHWLIDHRSTSLPEPRPVPEPVVLPELVVVPELVVGRGGVSTATVRFAASITDAEIDAYIATGEPLEVAGAFTIDSLGGAFISEVRGDPHAVVGLSLALVRELLLEFDVPWTDLWNRQL